MHHVNNSIDLLVFGVHLKSEGYPNTLFRLQDLESSGLFRISEINIPMWSESTQNRHGVSRLTRNICRSLVSHVAVLGKYLICSGWNSRMYIPYPGVFLLFMFSCLPKRLRPRRVVADVFISLYDTIVLDRKLLNGDSLLAKFLKWIEWRAYMSADILVVDTPQNQKYLNRLFNLPEGKIVVIPLSTDENNFQYVPYTPKSDFCRVLFVGTMAPLHGIEVLLETARLLSERSDIRFKLIGAGQDAGLVTAWLNRYKAGLDWEKNWQSSEIIAKEINCADICLGIFGAGDKTQRVCPFKIYAYASVGRAIITGYSEWLNDSICNLTYQPFATVPVNDAKALAEKILQLTDDPSMRSKLAMNSRRFYETHLGNQFALQKLAFFLAED